MKLLVATRSSGKMREIRRILAPVPDLTVLDLDEAGIREEPAEAGLEPYDTFEENALSKAHYFHTLTGLPTVADDSGIVVDALGDYAGTVWVTALNAGIGGCQCISSSRRDCTSIRFVRAANRSRHVRASWSAAASGPIQRSG